MCNHLFVDGFGGMGDAVVCINCGMDKYPEAIPLTYAIAQFRGRVVREAHPRYQEYVALARAARDKREQRESAKVDRKASEKIWTGVTRWAVILVWSVILALTVMFGYKAGELLASYLHIPLKWGILLLCLLGGMFIELITRKDGQSS